MVHATTNRANDVKMRQTRSEDSGNVGLDDRRTDTSQGARQSTNGHGSAHETIDVEEGAAEGMVIGSVLLATIEGPIGRR